MTNKIMCVETEQEFDSQIDCVRFYNEKHSAPLNSAVDKLWRTYRGQHFISEKNFYLLPMIKTLLEKGLLK